MGMPAAPGRYTVEVTFTFWRGGPPAAPPQPRIDPLIVSLTLPLDVDGPVVDWISPGVAMDALLADDRYSASVREYPRELWRGGDMTFDGETWTATYHFAASQTDEEPADVLVGVVDARTGEVVDVRLER